MADEVARLVAVMEAQLKGFTKGMEQAQREADRRFGAIERRMTQTEKRFTKGFSGMNLGKTLLAGGALVGVDRFVRAISQTADELQNTKDALGVSTDAQQIWGLLVAQNGVRAEKFNGALAKFAKNVGDASLGTGTFKKVLDGLGISPKGSIEEIFYRYADAIAATKDKTQQASLVQAAFGKGAAGFIPVLQQGSREIKRQGEELKRTGAIMDSQALAKIDAMGDKWEALKRRVVAGGGNALADGFEDFARAIEDPGFQSALKEFAALMAQVLKLIIKAGPYLPALAGAFVGAKTAGGIARFIPNPIAKAAVVGGGAIIGAAGAAYAMRRDKGTGAAGVPGAPGGAGEGGDLDRSGLLTDGGDKAADRLASDAIDRARDVREALVDASEADREASLQAAEARRDSVKAQDEALLQLSQGTEDFYDLQVKVINELASMDINAAQDRAAAEINSLNERRDAALATLEGRRQEEIASVEASKASGKAKAEALLSIESDYQTQREAITAAAASRIVGLQQSTASQIKAIQADLSAQLAQADENWFQRRAQMIHLTDGVRQGLMNIGSAARHGFGSMQDAAVRALETLADMVIEIGILKPLVDALLGPSGTTSGGIGGAILSGVMKSFGGFFAEGGNIRSGQWGIVGERGPEAVRAGAGGIQVMPNSALRSMPAMPRLGAPAERPMQITIKQQPGVAVEQIGMSRDEVVFEARRILHTEGPTVAAMSLRNPNGEVAKAARDTLNSQRRRT